MDFHVKLTGTNCPEQSKVIADVLQKHEDMYHTVNEHFKKEIIIQEDEFNKKMLKRRERTINKTFDKMPEKAAAQRYHSKELLINPNDQKLLGQMAEGRILLNSTN